MIVSAIGKTIIGTLTGILVMLLMALWFMSETIKVHAASVDEVSSGPREIIISTCVPPPIQTVPQIDGISSVDPTEEILEAFWDDDYRHNKTTLSM